MEVINLVRTQTELEVEIRKLKESLDRAEAQVSFQWENPDFLLKNVDFFLKNVDFVIKTVKPDDTGGLLLH